MGGFGGTFQKLPPYFSEVAFMWKSPDATDSGQLLRSLLQNPRNFSEVAPEVRPAVHTAALRLKKFGQISDDLREGQQPLQPHAGHDPSPTQFFESRCDMHACLLIMMAVLPFKLPLGMRKSTGMCPPYPVPPTYQLWPFSSAIDNHPKMPTFAIRRPATGVSRALSGPKCPRSVPESVPKMGGVRGSV